MKMKPNPNEPERSYHGREHDEDPTCHRTGDKDTPCEPIDSPQLSTEKGRYEIKREENDRDRENTNNHTHHHNPVGLYVGNRPCP